MTMRAVPRGRLEIVNRSLKRYTKPVNALMMDRVGIRVMLSTMKAKIVREMTPTIPNIAHIVNPFISSLYTT